MSAAKEVIRIKGTCPPGFSLHRLLPAFPGRRGGLFLKILLWFARTVSIVFLVSAGMMAYIQRDADEEHLQMALEGLREEGEQLVAEQETRTFVPGDESVLSPSRVWVFNRSADLLVWPASPFRFPGPGPRPRFGADENRRQPASFSPTLARKGLRHGQWGPGRLPPWMKEPDIRMVRAELASHALSLLSGPAEFGILEVGNDDYLGCKVSGKNDGRYAVFCRNRPRTSKVIFFVLTNPSVWLRFAVISTVIAFLCWWLARYLVRPLLKLQQMIRHADGDYQQRLPESLTGRYDELGDLASDLNRVATAIEVVVRGQQQLLRDVSHELRSPLARIRLSIELLRKGTQPSDSALLGKIERDLERLNELIQQVLEIARLDQFKTLPLKVEPMDLIIFVRKLLSTARFEAEPSSKIVREVFFAESIPMLASEEYLYRALENLLRNAIRHSPAGGEILVTVEPMVSASGRDFVRLKVVDQGPGVPSEYLERLFDPFFRCEEDRGRVAGGAGLGLSIVRKAIDAHHGEVKARNLNPSGLEVEILLPRKPVS